MFGNGTNYDVIASQEGYDFIILHGDKSIIYSRECLKILEWIKRKIALKEDQVIKPPGYVFYDGDSVFFRLVSKELSVTFIQDYKGEVSDILVPDGLKFKDVDAVMSYETVRKFLRSTNKLGYFLKSNKNGSYS